MTTRAQPPCGLHAPQSCPAMPVRDVLCFGKIDVNQYVVNPHHNSSASSFILINGTSCSLLCSFKKQELSIGRNTPFAIVSRMGVLGRRRLSDCRWKHCACHEARERMSAPNSHTVLFIVHPPF